jgi:hypothetical protein
MEGKFRELHRVLAKLQQEVASAHIAGERSRAECLTGKAVGIKNTMEIAEQAFLQNNQSAVGELEGMEHVIRALQPLKRC